MQDFLCEHCGSRKKPSSRSIQQHRLYWGMLNMLCDNQREEVFPGPYSLHVAIKVQLGYIHPRIDIWGKPDGYEADKMDFMSMDGKTFSQYMDKAITLVFNEIMPNIDSKEVRKNLSNMLMIYS